MWPPADISVLPTSQEVIDAKLAIEAVKTQLSDALLAQAHLQVDEISKELFERQAWIAPVRFLSFDVLSLIFEFCGEDDWETPVRISEVSRQWREIVLATPRAWAVLHLQASKIKHKLIHRIFSRSGHCPLHIYMPSMGDSTQTLLSAVEKRLRCLSIQGINEYLKGRVFPILDRLTLRYADFTPIDISHFNIQLPSLRHLICENYLTNSISGSSGATQWEFPPLQTLSLRITHDPAWLSLLTGVKNTLISLRLASYEQCTVQNPPMTLPALKCLDVRVLHNGLLVWLLDLKTPVLESYLEISCKSFGESPFHKDTQNVREMESDPVPALSYFPLLEILQLKEMSYISKIFDMLASNESISPNLREVQLVSYKTWDFSSLRTKLADVNRCRRVAVVLVNRLPGRELPYAIEYCPVRLNCPIVLHFSPSFSAGEECLASSLECWRFRHTTFPDYSDSSSVATYGESQNQHFPGCREGVVSSKYCRMLERSRQNCDFFTLSR
jgi:hypothetical protein